LPPIATLLILSSPIFLPTSPAPPTCCQPLILANYPPNRSPQFCLLPQNQRYRKRPRTYFFCNGCFLRRSPCSPETDTFKRSISLGSSGLIRFDPESLNSPPRSPRSSAEPLVPRLSLQKIYSRKVSDGTMNCSSFSAILYLSLLARWNPLCQFRIVRPVFPPSLFPLSFYTRKLERQPLLVTFCLEALRSFLEFPVYLGDGPMPSFFPGMSRLCAHMINLYTLFSPSKRPTPPSPTLRSRKTL